MAVASVYVKLEISPSSNYISVEDMVLERDIEEEYEWKTEQTREFDSMNQSKTSKMETLEGFKLQYILLKVTYDGRKRSVGEEDVKKTLEQQGMATRAGESMFGGFYLPTETLIDMMENQLQKRKQMLADGKFVDLKEYV